MTTIRKYSAAPCGRLLFGIAALALLGAGAIAVSGSTSAYAITLLVLVLVAASIVTVGITIAEFPGVAAVLVLSLPVICGFYFAALYAVMPTAGPVYGGAAIALGLVPAFLAVRPTASLSEHRMRKATPLRTAA